MNQSDKILDLLSDGKFHTTIELNAICWRYGARLWDLREAGYLFEKRPGLIRPIEEWRLVGYPDREKPTTFRVVEPPYESDRIRVKRKNSEPMTVAASGNMRSRPKPPEGMFRE